MEKTTLRAVADALTAHGFHVLVFDDRRAVEYWLREEFAAVDTVGRGGSVTLDELGFDEIIQDRGMKLFNHTKALPSKKRETWQAANSADAYFLSANAITADGKIFNVDGAGNRVAAMSFGPKKVYYVVGKNKLVADLDEAYRRLEQVAAPKNVARLNLPTGCAKTGQCVDCNSPKRICNVYTILTRVPWAIEEAWVLLVNEEMGY